MRLTIRGRQGRVSERQRSESLGQRNLTVVVEVLVAEEHDTVREQRSADLGDRVVGELVAGVDAADLRG